MFSRNKENTDRQIIWLSVPQHLTNPGSQPVTQGSLSLTSSWHTYCTHLRHSWKWVALSPKWHPIWQYTVCADWMVQSNRVPFSHCSLLMSLENKDSTRRSVLRQWTLTSTTLEGDGPDGSTICSNQKNRQKPHGYFLIHPSRHCGGSVSTLSFQRVATDLGDVLPTPRLQRVLVVMWWCSIVMWCSIVV
jgi:hypothetical protein